MSRANTVWRGRNNNAEVRCETSIHITVIIVLWAGQVDLLLLPLPSEPFSLHCLLPEMKYLHYQTPGVPLNPLPGACISDDKASRPSLSAWYFKDIWSLTMSHVFQYHVKSEAGLHSLKRKKEKSLLHTHTAHAAFMWRILSGCANGLCTYGWNQSTTFFKFTLESSLHHSQSHLMCSLGPVWIPKTPKLSPATADRKSPMKKLLLRCSFDQTVASGNSTGPLDDELHRHPVQD